MLITPTLKPLPPFAHLAGRTVTTRPSRALRRRMRTPETLTISQWADKYRRVTEIDAKPGRWRNEMVPHAVPIMDSICRPWVRQVWICLPERAAKTQILINTVCWGIDQGSQAGNIFWLMPTEHDARKAMGERIIPVFRARDDHSRPGRIARYLSDAVDDTSRGTIRFNHGVRLFPAWANSPGSMASYFGRINIADECDKFPQRTSEGSDPITLFLKRARDDRARSKYVFASTPAGRFIHKGLTACAQIWTWSMRCPDCGGYVQPGEEHLHVPEGTTAETAATAEIGLACPDCGTVWDEDGRAEAYRGGREVCIKGADDPRPATVGHHAPAWVFPTIPLAEIAAAKLRADTGDHAAKVAWANGYKVEDYEEETATVSEEGLLKFKSELPRGLVPPATAKVVLLVDTQQDSFYYQVWAFGYAPNITLHMMEHGIAGDFTDLEGLLAQDWHDHDGKVFRIANGIIDSGGTRHAFRKHSRTAEVYEWCAKNRTVMPLKGLSGDTGDMFSYKNLATYPKSNRPIPGGLKRANIRVDLFKNDLASRLDKEEDHPAAPSFHDAIDAPFAKHYTSEGKNDRGEWVHDTKKGRNDYWDCTVYALALREMIKLRIPRNPEDKTKKKKSFTASKGVSLDD